MRWLLVPLVVAAASCSMAPVHYPTLHEHVLSLRKGDLEAAGIAFVTPSSVLARGEAS